MSSVYFITSSKIIGIINILSMLFTLFCHPDGDQNAGVQMREAGNRRPEMGRVQVRRRKSAEKGERKLENDCLEDERKETGDRRRNGQRSEDERLRKREDGIRRRELTETEDWRTESGKRRLIGLRSRRKNFRKKLFQGISISIS